MERGTGRSRVREAVPSAKILMLTVSDEEDDLFPPAVELLPLETWDDLARRAEQLERSSPA